jgi:calmodulin
VQFTFSAAQSVFMFDSGKSGHIEKEKVRTILNTLGHTFNDFELEALLEEQDKEGD